MGSEGVLGRKKGGYTKGVVKYPGSNTWVDPKTGEPCEHRSVFVQRRARNEFKEFVGFGMEALDILSEANITKESLRVLLKLCGRLEFGNWALVSRQEIASELKLQPTHVSRAIRQLIDEGYVMRGKRIGGAYCYQLNPSLGWRGDSADHKTAIRQWEAQMAKLGMKVLEGGKSKTKTKPKKNGQTDIEDFC